MCPLRFILVFFSALLAGYFAWKTVRLSPEIEDFADESTPEGTQLNDKEGLNLKRNVQDGFWAFVDMAMPLGSSKGFRLLRYIRGPSGVRCGAGGVDCRETMAVLDGDGAGVGFRWLLFNFVNFNFGTVVTLMRNNVFRLN